ncbi:hypothetical protein NQ314_013367 [Rhamnusium bicolor]|uniref:Uncharacterized protein n=1 Tax=Rhamnusium bicolor TaxID=1586634 RepID=A0AAV8X6B3_9CUCU|nr:hypothetical protein NQ314_013367 [Rhamnusium bicolor]
MPGDKVLDLYSQTDSSNAPDSPPMHLQKLGQALPANPTRTSNGHEKVMSPDQPPPVNTKIPPPSSDIPPFPYQTFTGAPPPVASYASAFSTSMSAPPGVPAPPHMTGPPPGPPPHINAPPPAVFPYVSHPPPFTTVVPPEVHLFSQQMHLLQVSHIGHFIHHRHRIKFSF